MMRRGVPLVVSVLVAASLAVGCHNPAGSEGVPGRRRAVRDRLPDLGMAPLKDVHLQHRSDGRRLLRYSTTIVNVGVGPFELHATRADTGEMDMTVMQRVFDEAEGWRDVRTAAGVDFGGDGHDHWHIHDLQQSELLRLDDGSDVGRSDKRGFCFWDNVEYRLTLLDAPAAPVYARPACGDLTSLEISMGLSVGWGDIYPAGLPDQYVDVTGLPPGRYRLRVSADPFRWFLESDRSNQATWVDVELASDGTLQVLATGPSA